MKITSAKLSESSSGIGKLNEVELTDEDIIDAMKHISGYLDISTEDFKRIYGKTYETLFQ